MEYRSFGRTGVQISPLCLGCMNFGGKTTPQEGYTIIDRALDAGINFFDTANIYQKGKNEELVGTAFKQNGRRDKIVLATKVWGRMTDEPNDAGISRRHILQQCEASLRRLQTDYIDLYQIHHPSPHIPIDETLRAFDDLVRSGKVRYIGTSNFAAWRIMDGLWASKEHHLHRFVSEQSPYNILDRRLERELIPMAQSYGLAVIPWSPIAGGLLSGKYSKDQPAPEGSRFSNLAEKPLLSTRWNERIFDVINPLQTLAASKNCTVSQFALAWCLQQPGITAPIIGPRTMEQLEDYLRALDVVITEEDRQTVDSLVDPGEMVSPFYNTHPAPHPYHW